MAATHDTRTTNKCRKKACIGVEPKSTMAESPIVLYTATSDIPLNRKYITHKALSPTSMVNFRFIVLYDLFPLIIISITIRSQVV